MKTLKVLKFALCFAMAAALFFPIWSMMLRN